MKYRPEIDGLRALAIIPVIFSHAGFSAFSGGFIGVDVFFVISGYLITSIILKEKRNGSFSLFAFYERRIRRIIPPLFTMLVASAMAAFFILTPTEMKRFSQSLVAVIFSSSNMLFWKTHGYFESSSDLKPLLHTWSLGVEEQFYLFFPLVFLFPWRDRSRRLPIIVLVLILCSFVTADVLVKTDPVFAFYNLMTRAWELLIGAFVAVLPRSQTENFCGERSNKDWRKIRAGILGLIGIVFIALPYFLYDNHTATPGKSVLIPTIGAALVLNYASGDNFVGKLLSVSPLRWIGLLSYSAYLWHQPIFAFARYTLGSYLNAGVFCLLIILVFVVAYLSYRYIEKPWRNQAVIGRRKGVMYLIGLASILFAFGVGGHVTKGYPDRLSSREREILGHFDNSLPEMKYYYSNKIDIAFRDDCSFYNNLAHRNGGATVMPLSTNLSVDCFSRKSLNSKVVFVWGDSHAQHLYSGLKKNMPADWEILQVASQDCHPRIVSEPSVENYCEHSNWFALTCIRNSRPNVVVVSQDRNCSVDNMNAIYAEMRKVGVGRVVFVGPSPRFLIPVPEVFLKTLNNDMFDPRKFIDKKILDEDLFLKTVLQTNDTYRYVSAVDCFKGIPDVVFVGSKSPNNLIIFDTDHLTPIGSDYLAKRALVEEITVGVQ